MNSELTPNSSTRPNITDYQDLVIFFQAMLDYRKATERNFSVLRATASLRRVSPSLVSLILKRERKMTLDRAEELSKLMNLHPQEKFYFKNWLHRNEPGIEPVKEVPVLRPRREAGPHILQDWINVYVKDCFQIPRVQKNPQLIYQCLGNYASPQRIDRSIDFLIREGHLKKNQYGHIFIETHLAVSDPKVSSKKIRQFHKGALDIAKSALEIFPPQERLANTLTLPLNDKSYAELMELIQEFTHRLQDFAASNTEEGDRLYQFILNLSPTGGKIE